MEAGQYGLTLVTCFLACRLELDAVAGLLSISWYALGGGGFFRVFFSLIFFALRTHTACWKYEAASCLIYLSTIIVPGYVRHATSDEKLQRNVTSIQQQQSSNRYLLMVHKSRDDGRQQGGLEYL